MQFNVKINGDIYQRGCLSKSMIELTSTEASPDFAPGGAQGAVHTTYALHTMI